MNIQDPNIADTRAAVRRGANALLSHQEKVLTNIQAFTEAWLGRRQAGTQAAIEATQKFWSAQSPAEAMAEYQNWAKGAMERSVADAVAFQDQFAQIAAQSVELAQKNPAPN